MRTFRVDCFIDVPQANPPTDRNAPPTSGNIAWARNLLQRIEAPMLVFKENDAIMKTAEASSVVRLYNKA